MDFIFRKTGIFFTALFFAGFVFVFQSHVAFASLQASFSANGAFLVGNHADAGTQNWTSNLYNIKPGDQVAFKFTFLNNSSVKAIAAASSFSATTNGNVITVTGTIWAQNASPVSNTVRIYAANGYSISLSQMNASFGGVGDVLPGASNVEYYVTGLYTIVGQNNSSNQPPSVQLWAEYPLGTRVTQVSRGTAVYLVWNSTNATECHTLAGAGFDTQGRTQGYDQVSPLAGTTVFSIQCSNPYGSNQANARVEVIDKPSVQLWAEYPLGTRVTQVSRGTAVYLVWNSTNATECHTLAGAGFDTQGRTQGYDQVSPLAGTTVFSIQCSNPYGSTQANARVEVVGTNPPPSNQPSVYLSAYPTVVIFGGATTLQWNSTNATECHALSGDGFSTEGRVSGTDISSPLYRDTTFTISCSNSTQSSVASVFVSVINNNNPPPSGSAPAVQTLPASNVLQNSATLNGSVDPNLSATSYWFEYGTSQSLGNSTAYHSAGSGDYAINVSDQISSLSPNTTYYFRIVAQNSYGKNYGSILSFTTANDSSGGGGGNNGSAPAVVTGGASGVSRNSAQITGYVNPNGSQTSYWFEYGTSQSLGNSTAYQSAGSGSSSSFYSATINGLMENTTYYYRIVAQNAYGKTNGSILSFTTPSGNSNNQSCLSAPYVQTLPATNISFNSVQLNGSVNSNGCQTSYWFEYGISQSLGNSTAYQSVSSGNGTINVSSYISNLNYNGAYYFRIVAQNSAGISYGNILSFYTNQQGCNGFNCGYGGGQPLVQTYNATNIGNNSATLNGLVNPNTYGLDSTYAWFEYGTNPSNLYSTTNSSYVGSGNYSQNFSQTIYNLMSNTNYYFRIVARNSYGTSYGQILSFSTGYYNNQQNTSGAPQVVTNDATYVFRNSALLNGQVNPNGLVTNAWFEYGTDTNLGYKTNVLPVGSANNFQNFSAALSGLSANTTYYFRAVAQNSNGTVYGSILTFRTTNGTNSVPINTNNSGQQQIIVRTVTSSSNQGLSCLVLIPSLNVSNLIPQEKFTFTVTYKNGCDFNLSNAFLKVILPPQVNFVSTNYPFFNRDANGISYNLGVVSPGNQSAISIDGIVDSSAREGDSLIFSSVLNFNDSSGKFQSVSYYLTAIVGSRAFLGATVLEAFRNLFGNWLFDLILLLGIIFAIYWIFFKKDRQLSEEDVLEARPLIINEADLKEVQKQ
jgi:hypothetical protein